MKMEEERSAACSLPSPRSLLRRGRVSGGKGPSLAALVLPLSNYFLFSILKLPSSVCLIHMESRLAWKWIMYQINSKKTGRIRRSLISKARTNKWHSLIYWDIVEINGDYAITTNISWDPWFKYQAISKWTRHNLNLGLKAEIMITIKNIMIINISKWPLTNS